MNVRFHKAFEKRFAKLPKSVQKEFYKRLAVFLRDPFEHGLYNHPLRGKLKNKRSINITGDYRALFEQRGDTATFLLIGTHSELYGK